MRAVDTRRYAGQPSLTSTEEQTRNGNITQHSREMLGWLWQQVHIMAGMSPTTTTGGRSVNGYGRG